ncbi:MAG: DUF2845 domain-containing protein [Deltaproteobacteria bacterium]|nr:DUF2845 domain-containing protein [Deltaproteobacteria bacterium]
MAVVATGREKIAMKNALGAVLAGVALLSLSRLALASELRCGGRLVLPGDSAADVLERCGPPASLQRLGSRGFGEAASGGRGKTARIKPSKSADREVWTYASTGQLARLLTFRKGRVAQIDVGGYAR